MNKPDFLTLPTDAVERKEKNIIDTEKEAQANAVYHRKEALRIEMEQLEFEERGLRYEAKYGKPMPVRKHYADDELVCDSIRNIYENTMVPSIAVSTAFTKNGYVHPDTVNEFSTTVLRSSFSGFKKCHKEVMEQYQDKVLPLSVRILKEVGLLKPDYFAGGSTLSAQLNRMVSFIQRSEMDIATVEAFKANEEFNIENMDLKQRVQSLERAFGQHEQRITDAEVGIANNNMQLQALGLVEWKEQAITLKLRGLTNVAISKQVGKGRQAVSTLLNTDEVKAFLEGNK